ncbi:MAG: hypothetical protein M1355_00695 [Patescibacteria group bacterium]|nr:hypothetical protein [Patescibacteria group bacterium]MCL5093644.1 hypothetical protein [Patescibacteria group bacterium]
MKLNQKGSTALVVTIIVSVVLIAGTGLGIYYWQRSVNNKLETENKKQIEGLQKQIEELQKGQSNAGITSNSSTTVANDETANWKTYTDTKNGFSFKYPASGYTLTEGAYTRGILFTFNLNEDKYRNSYEYPGKLTISGYVKASSIRLDNWITTTDAVGLNYINGSLKSAEVGQNDGYSFSQAGMFGYTAYAAAKGDNAFIISTINSQDPTFVKILSTFKLL